MCGACVTRVCGRCLYVLKCVCVFVCVDMCVCVCVYVCRSADDARTSTRVAVKKIGNLFNDPDSALRMLREIKLITRMRHNNVRMCVCIWLCVSCVCVCVFVCGG